MQKRIFVLVGLIAIVSAGMLSNVMGAEDISKNINRPMGSASVQSGEGAGNASTYQEILNASWRQYGADFSYSSKTLDDFVKKNITGKDAMIETTMIYVLMSQTLDDLYKAQPPKNLEKYHNYTLQTLTNFKNYLWNMAKFYETNQREYALQGRENFNQSNFYREKALEESILHD